MAIVLNTSGRAIHTQLCSHSEKEERVRIKKRFSFSPGILVTVEDKDWKELLKQDLIQECVDDEILETGSRARKKGDNAEKDLKEIDVEAKRIGKEKEDK